MPRPYCKTHTYSYTLTNLCALCRSEACDPSSASVNTKKTLRSLRNLRENKNA